MTTATAADAGNGHITGFGTKGYRAYVLVALTLIYTLNFIDRTIITVVAQPIINTFSLTDTQWGLLTGPPFALFYAVMGIPIAMWADRGNRVFIIALCVVIWSLMTVFCGLAASFIWLLVFRIGVAIGEVRGRTPLYQFHASPIISRPRAGRMPSVSIRWASPSAASSRNCSAGSSPTRAGRNLRQLDQFHWPWRTFLRHQLGRG